MTGGTRTPGLAGGLVAAVLSAAVALTVLAPESLRAQEDDPAPADTIPGDRVVTDTLPELDVDLEDVDAEEGPGELTGGEFPDRDEMFDELSGMSGFRVVQYRGREVELGVREEEVRLRESARADYAEAALEADSIVYRTPVQFLTAQGGVRMTGPDRQDVVSDSVLYYDVSSLKGTVMDARTEFSARGAMWHVRGNVIPLERDEVFVRDGSFTSCELDEPHYYFKASQIRLVDQNMIVAWPVVFYVHDVPVFWLPFFAQDIRPDRRSGFLPPRFGINDIVRPNRGVGRQISDFGYYFAINDFMDAEVTVDWFAGRFTRLNAGYRYRVLKKFISGNVNVSHEWGPDGRNLRVDFNHDQRLSPDTRIRGSGTFSRRAALLQDRSFDVQEQTQSLDSELGIRHRFPFADLSLNARRRQPLGPVERTTLTLPDMNISFSPVTLFRAPSARAGFFNNATWSGSARFSRTDDSRVGQDDRLTTRGSVSQSMRFGGVGLSAGGRIEDELTTLVDSAGQDSATVRVTDASWQTSSRYRVGLMGSTTLDPRVEVQGAFFRSPDTDDSFVAGPVRPGFGATLRTDVFGFFPGFGSLTRIRHKVSPSFNWRFRPAVSVDEELEDIPGFPGGAGRTQNTLSINLSQTFEAKVRSQPREEPPEVAPPDDLEASDPETRDMDEVTPEGADGIDGEAREEAEGETRRPARREEERTITLLSINTSALQFDFARRDEPKLVSGRMTNRFSSDLVRGLRVSMTHDLFEGTGQERSFSPSLSSLTASFSLRSGRGMGGAAGPDIRGGPGTRQADRDVGDPRRDLSDADPEAPTQEARRETGGGPWNLSLNYSLERSRSGQPGTTRQGVGVNLRFEPTPNWQINWNTRYSFTENEFGFHRIEARRELHRWLASFIFSEAPNGNFVFQFSLHLTDAPELRVDYDQRSIPGAPVFQ